MSDDLCERNRLSLAARHPDLAAAITREAPLPPGWRLITERADPSLLLRLRDRDHALHSRFEPRREADRLVAQQLPAAPAAVLLLGAGLGYAAEAILARTAGSTPLLVIFESPTMLDLACRARDLTALWACPRVFVAIGDDGDALRGALERFFEAHPVSEASLVVPPASCRAFPALHEGWRDEVEVALNTSAGRARTGAALSRLWRAHLLENLPALLAAPGLTSLRGAARGQAAVCVGAGPSLDDALDHLPALCARALIICADSAAGPLLRRGIAPDFICVADAVDDKVNVVAALPLPRATIGVLMEDAHPGFWRVFGARALAVARGGSLTRWLEETTGPRDTLGEVFTVGNMTAMLAAWMGADQALLLGLDFALCGARRHARDVPERWHDPGLDDAQALPRVPGVDGRPVTTYPNLALAARHLDRFLAGSATRFYDGRGAGAALPHAERIAIADFAPRALRAPPAPPIKPAFDQRKRQGAAFLARLDKSTDFATTLLPWGLRVRADLKSLYAAARAEALGGRSARDAQERLNAALRELARGLDGDPLLAEGFAEASVAMTAHAVISPKNPYAKFGLRNAHLLARAAMREGRRTPARLQRARAALQAMIAPGPENRP